MLNDWLLGAGVFLGMACIFCLFSQEWFQIAFAFVIVGVVFPLGCGACIHGRLS
jgi:hypothetical protein